MLKFATAQVIDAVLVPANAGHQRLARLRRDAHRHHFNYTPRPGYLYVRSRAISSRCNDNYDEFPAEEIEKSYKTFIGKPVFVNHVNDNHRRARGVVIDAALHRDRLSDGEPDTWAEVLMEIDAIRFPKLAKAILNKRIDRTSMGTDVAYSVCSACGNKATTPAEYCFLPGTLVTMADGTLKPIEQIEAGDRVLTHDGASTVVAPMERHYNGLMSRIHRGAYGAPLFLTHGHQVLTNRKGHRDERFSGERRYASVHQEDNWEWTASEMIEPGHWVQGAYPTEVALTSISLADLATDIVADGERARLASIYRAGSHRGQAQYGKHSMPLVVDNQDEALGFVLGLFAAEGSFEQAVTSEGTYKTISWSLGSHEDDLVHDLTLALDKLGAGSPKIYSRGGGIQVRLSNAPLAALLATWVGTGAKTKHLSSEIMLAPAGFQRVFLDAYYRGDGWDDPSGHVEVRTVGDLLARQLVMLGARVEEMIPSWWINTKNPGGPSNRGNIGTVHHLGMGRSGAMQGRRRLVDGYFANRVTKVEDDWYHGPVYNFEVAGQNSYVAEGVVVHNCQHIPRLKGKKISSLDSKTGQRTTSIIREKCYGLSFFENSLLVEPPADPTAFFLGVDDSGLKMVANHKTAEANFYDCPECGYPQLYEGEHEENPDRHRRYHHMPTDPAQWQTLHGITDVPSNLHGIAPEDPRWKTWDTKHLTFHPEHYRNATEDLYTDIGPGDRIENTFKPLRQSLNLRQHFAAQHEKGSPEYKRHYQRGWASGTRGSGLERADINGEPNAWYDGYMDASTGRPKWSLMHHPSAEAADEALSAGWTPPARGKTALREHFAAAGDDRPCPLCGTAEWKGKENDFPQPHTWGEHNKMEMDLPCQGGRCRTYSDPHSSREHYERNTAQGLDPWGQKIKQPYDGHGAWDCNNRNCAEHPQEMYEQKRPGHPFGMPGWMQHDLAPAEESDARREIDKHFYETGQADDAEWLMRQQKQGPTKYSLREHFAALDREHPDAVHSLSHPGHPKSPTLCNLPGANCKVSGDESGVTCGECQHEIEGSKECDEPYCQENGFPEGWHTKAEHMDPSHQDPGHPDYQSAERFINDALKDHPDAWLINHQSTGPTKYSSQRDDKFGWKNIPTDPMNMSQCVSRLDNPTYCLWHKTDHLETTGEPRTDIDGHGNPIDYGKHTQIPECDLCDGHHDTLHHYEHTENRPYREDESVLDGLTEDTPDDGHRSVYLPHEVPGDPNARYKSEPWKHSSLRRSAARGSLWPEHPLFRPGDVVSDKGHKAHVESVDENTDPDAPGRVWIRREGDDYPVGIHPANLTPHPDAPAEQHEFYHSQRAKNERGEPYVPQTERDIDESDRVTVHHLTSNPSFAPDPTYRPANNTTLGGDLSPRLFVGDPNRWAEGEYHYRQPYVAEMSAPRGVVQGKGGYLGEQQIPARHYDKVTVNRVLPYPEYERERDEPGYRSSIDTRSWTPEQHREHLKSWRDHLHDEHNWGWNEFDENHNHVGLDDEDWDEHMHDPSTGYPGTYVRRDRNGEVMRSVRSSLLRHFAAKKIDEPTHAGLVLKAKDTGRILMLQRSLEDDDDPAKGTWEFPGGGIEPGDQHSLDAAKREWEEEVGQPFPDGGTVSYVWRSPNGVYQGHVVVIPEESAVNLAEGRAVTNPDDPDGDYSEQVAWWDPKHAQENPALRREVKKSPWDEIRKAASAKDPMRYAKAWADEYPMSPVAHPEVVSLIQQFPPTHADPETYAKLMNNAAHHHGMEWFKAGDSDEHHEPIYHFTQHHLDDHNALNGLEPKRGVRTASRSGVPEYPDEIENGEREHWSPGDRAHFEYHCWEDPESHDADLWYRSHRPVTVTGEGDYDKLPGSDRAERIDAAMPKAYTVQFDDGHHGTVFEDELKTHPKHFYRPDPPPMPKESVKTASTDRWVTDEQGHTHWGAAGAAGVMIRHTDDKGERHYLLQHRVPWVDHGDTWSIPGGALHADESPEEGARREAREEIGRLPADLQHAGTHTDDHGGWAYHTVLFDSPSKFETRNSGETGEHGTRWVPEEEVGSLPLHPGFATSWSALQKRSVKTADMHLGPEDHEHLQHLLNAMETQREMDRYNEHRVVDTSDPDDLRAHLYEAHGYDDSDLWRNSHDEHHPAFGPSSDVDRPLTHSEVKRLHDWEHGHGIKNEHPDYDGGEPGHFIENSHFHTATRKTATRDLTKHSLPASEVQIGDYLDNSGKVRVHNTMQRGDTVTLAWKLRGSKAPGVRQHDADEQVTVWRPGGKTAAQRWVNYDALPPDAQASIHQYMSEGEFDSPEEMEAHKRRYQYQTEDVPVEEFKRRVMQHGDEKTDWGNDFENYHKWYQQGPGLKDHGESRWHAIENDPGMMSGFGYLQDGWHRSHSYVNRGDTHIPVVRLRGKGKTAAADYRGSHQPPSPGDGPVLHEMPSDVVEHPEYYGAHRPAPVSAYHCPIEHQHAQRSYQAATESVEQMRKAQGNPDHPVTIYRAVPKSAQHITPGDWISLSPTYAQIHGDAENAGPEWKILKATVPAKHVVWGQDTMDEYGYHGPEIKNAQEHKGRLPELPYHDEETWHSAARKTASPANARPWADQSRSHRDDEGNEYEMRYTQRDEGERKPRHNISIFHEGKPVGDLDWYGTTGTVHHINVEPDYARRGLATAMWNWSQEMRPRAKHSKDRTDMGDAWARTVSGPLPRRTRASQGDGDFRSHLDRMFDEIGRENGYEDWDHFNRSTRDTAAMDDLIGRYEGGPQHPLHPGRFSAEDHQAPGDKLGQPYYEVEDPEGSGFTARDYSGGQVQIHHKATGDEPHDFVDNAHPESQGDYLHRGQAPLSYGHSELHTDLRNWVHGDPNPDPRYSDDIDPETGKGHAAGPDYANYDPRIKRWQQRNGYRG